MCLSLHCFCAVIAVVCVCFVRVFCCLLSRMLIELCCHCCCRRCRPVLFTVCLCFLAVYDLIVAYCVAMFASCFGVFVFVVLFVLFCAVLCWACVIILFY